MQGRSQGTTLQRLSAVCARSTKLARTAAAGRGPGRPRMNRRPVSLPRRRALDALFLERALARAHAAYGPRIPVVDPAQIVLRVVRVGETGEPQFPAGEPEPMVARDPLLARVVDADAQQLAVVGFGQVEIVAHGRRHPFRSSAAVSKRRMASERFMIFS